MKRYQGICCLTLVTLLLVTAGCSGKKKPEGLPDLYPLTIKLVYDDGSPVEGATVQIISLDKSATQRWNTSGKTDAKGEAAMRTYGEYAGAPVGNYKVVVNNEEIVYDNGDPPQIKERYNHIERQYTSIQNSSLTLEVKPVKEKTVVELNVGKSVREAIAGPPG